MTAADAAARTRDAGTIPLIAAPRKRVDRYASMCLAKRQFVAPEEEHRY